MKKLISPILVISMLVLTIVYSTPVSSSKINDEKMSQIEGAWSWKCSLLLAAYGAAIAGAVLSILASGGAVLPALLSYGGGYALAAMSLYERGCIPAI
ncbi:MAG: hypothetical protein ACE5WD_13565 [Candidatus Aminicenantia bacterium]